MHTSPKENPIRLTSKDINTMSRSSTSKKNTSVGPDNPPAVVPIGIQMNKWNTNVRPHNFNKSTQPFRVKGGKMFYPVTNTRSAIPKQSSESSIKIVSEVAAELAKIKEQQKVSPPQFPKVSDVSLDMSSVSTPATTAPKKVKRQRNTGNSIEQKSTIKKNRKKTITTNHTIKALGAARLKQKASGSSRGNTAKRSHNRGAKKH